MDIVPIFADRLYSFRYYNDDTRDEFLRLFEDWQDAEYLEDFFEANKSDLQNGFFTPVPTVEQAVLATKAEAKRLEKHLLYLAKDDNENLDSIFKPLSEQEDNFPFPRYKAYGFDYKSWLRIYALKIGHRYYITGGTIKLTKAMRDRTHTTDELRKIGRCSTFFKELGIDDLVGVKELDIEFE